MPTDSKDKLTLKNKGILIINTGSPLTLTKNSVRKYLNEFLTDERVISIWGPARQILVRGIIAPFRCGTSMRKYKHVWTPEGPLLRIYTQRLVDQIHDLTGRPTVYAMRYEKGSVDKALHELSNHKDIEKVIVLPLFPHYAKSSFESACEFVCRRFAKMENLNFSLETVSPYYDHPDYINILARNILRQYKEGMHLIFSYHGLPLSHVREYEHMPQKDYHYQCLRTTELVMQHPDIARLNSSHEISFQSRLGPNKWLSPATADRLASLPSEDKNDVMILCPSFICDCLETIEELGVEGRETYKSNGGENYSLLACPNDDHSTSQMLLNVIRDNLSPIDYWVDGRDLGKE